MRDMRDMRNLTREVRRLDAERPGRKETTRHWS